MLQVDVAARVRQTFGKGAARTLRRTGKTPAVLYGPAIDPLALELDTKPLTKTLFSIHRQNAVVTLDVDDGKGLTRRHVMVKEIQTDPVQDSIIHADFVEISLERKLTLTVPLKYSGKAKGVDMGGDLVVAMDKVALKGKVLDIPDFIEIDVSSLSLEDAVTCKDLNIPENITLQSPPDKVCVSVTGSSE